MRWILSSLMRIMLSLPCLNVRTPKPIFLHRLFRTDYELAHPNPKRLIESSSSILTEEECETAARELRRFARVDGFGKFMDENNLDLIVTNSDCNLVPFTACSGDIFLLF